LALFKIIRFLKHKESGADIWPSNNTLREAKRKRRPSAETVNISEDRAEVNLHTSFSESHKPTAFNFIFRLNNKFRQQFT